MTSNDNNNNEMKSYKDTYYYILLIKILRKLAIIYLIISVFVTSIIILLYMFYNNPMLIISNTHTTICSYFELDYTTYKLLDNKEAYEDLEEHLKNHCYGKIYYPMTFTYFVVIIMIIRTWGGF
jgi:hypothetical protein